jgi:choline dehydrogenase
VLANRLSADPKNRVLLLEAGGNDNWIWFHIPVGYLFAIGNPRSDWMFKTEPEPGLNGRALAYPRGKVIGGSSAINAMISCAARPPITITGASSASPAGAGTTCCRSSKRHEDHFLGDSEHHGTGGGWRIERRGCPGPCSTRSARPRRRWASADRRFQHRRQ